MPLKKRSVLAQNRDRNIARSGLKYEKNITPKPKISVIINSTGHNKIKCKKPNIL